ncbi:hypothetical protein C8Q79DRAFT_873779, partial [Trametes meyenii]
LRLRIVWVPGHQGIEGNEWADTEAKAAAEGDSTALPKSLTCLQDLPCSQSALKAQYKERVAAEWKERWQSSPQGIRLKRTTGDVPP